jgi:hypothetical protein
MFGRNHASGVKFIIFQAITPRRQNRSPFFLIHSGNILLAAPVILFLKTSRRFGGKANNA